MAGHNKWSKIKRKKGVTDARRSKVWARITRDMMAASRDGGGDPDMNPRLALFVDKAKAENMPKDNIERAIKRGTGEIEGADYEELAYEGYASGGIAVYVEALTDNTNRTVADVRSLFSKAGGNMGTSGSVAFLFDQKAVFEIPASGLTEDDLFLLVADAGAEDLRKDENEEGEPVFVVEAPTDAFGAVQAALDGAGHRALGGRPPAVSHDHHGPRARGCRQGPPPFGGAGRPSGHPGRLLHAGDGRGHARVDRVGTRE